MRFVSDQLKIAQVPIGTLTKEAVKMLRKKAGFVDTDATLNEFMVSVDTIEEVVKEANVVKNELQALFAEVSQYQYIHVTTI